jgi:hypothetical protein
MDAMEADTVALTERVVNAVAEVLPHTPVAGIGINFRFVDQDPSDEIVDMLKSGEALEQIGVVSSSTFSSTIQRANGCVLNLSREVENGVVGFNFNYHSPMQSMRALPYPLPGSIQGFYDQSKHILNTIYHIDVDGIEFVTALNENLGR